MAKTPPKKAPEGGVTISLRLARKQLEELETLAERAGMTRSSVIQLAVGRILKQGL